MPRAGGGRQKRRRRRNPGPDSGVETRKKSSSVVLVWSLALALSALGVICAAVFLWVKKGKTPPGGTPAAIGRLIPRGARLTSRFPSPGEDEALALVKQAVMARDPASIENFFRLDGANPSEAVLFLEEMSRHDGPIKDFNWIGSKDRNGLLIDAVLVRSQSGDVIKNRIAMLTPDDHGVWKTDFHAFARTCHPEWSEIAKESSKGGKARVFFRNDSYYNGVFSDDKVWFCRLLWSADGEETLFAYCRVDSAQHKALDRILRRSQNADSEMFPAMALVEIRRVEGAEIRQFEVTRVLAEGWVMAATPFDETAP
jgi:hypothetical protein